MESKGIKKESQEGIKGIGDKLVQVSIEDRTEAEASEKEKEGSKVESKGIGSKASCEGMKEGKLANQTAQSRSAKIDLQSQKAGWPGGRGSPRFGESLGKKHPQNVKIAMNVETDDINAGRNLKEFEANKDMNIEDGHEYEQPKIAVEEKLVQISIESATEEEKDMVKTVSHFFLYF